MRTVKILLFLFCLVSVQLGWAAESDVFHRAEQFHGDSCTGLIIGLRLGVAAKQALTARGAEGKLKARVYTNGCPVDGIQVATGATLGTRSIEVIDRKENVLILSDKKGTKQVEARLTPVAQQKSKRSLELKKLLGTAPEGSEKARQLQEEAEAIKAWFRTAADDQVIVVRKVR